MGKRERFGGSEDVKVAVDRVSMLPNEVLGLILSSLTMKKAAATSILSRRWRKLWTLTPKLDLDGTEFLERVNYGLALEKERHEYVRWVDRIVGCSSAPSLEELRIYFDLSKEHTTHIDGWQASRDTRRYDECYNFPYRKWNFPDGFKLIKKLSTHKVNVSGEALEFFLGNCLLLEQLSVSASGDLKTLSIIQTFPSFKCLEISVCNHLHSLVIRDSNLVTLKYCGARLPNFEVLNAPLLTQLWIRGRLMMSNMKHVVEMFWAVLPQLQMFKIYYLCNGPSWDETTAFLSTVRMLHLKQLVVQIGQLDNDPDSLLPLINLISASPYLRRLVVEVEVPAHMRSARDHLLMRGPRKYVRVYPHLKEVEFVGYRGMNSQFQLIMHLVENNVALQNIVVDARCFKTSSDYAWDLIFQPKVDEEMLARAYAKEQLKKRIMVKRERFGDSEDVKVSVDRMSMLPSEVLGLILSSLTMKEAAATSILSRRWRNVWTLTPKLDLDGTEFIERVIQVAGENGYNESATENERREYVRWVDRVVGCSAAGRLVEFRLLFDLTNKHATHIDGWLHLAISKKVERLELNLTDRVSYLFRRYHECYDFPYKKGNFPDGLKMIKKLSTHNVNVSGDALEFFLGNCPLLEQLTVSGSGHLTALKIIRTFPSFKCLEISLCDHLDSLVIRDSDLVTLKYSGKRILDFQLLNVPLLTQLWISGRLISNMKHVVGMFSPLLPQLQMFKIYFVCNPSWDETTTFLSAVRMSNLKKLEVTIGGARSDPTLLPLINLISASPCLRRFVVEVRNVSSSNLLRRGCGTRKSQIHTRVYECPHLNEVEFVGYRSMDSMFHELIMYFRENYVALENIVVDPRSSVLSLDRPWDRIFRPNVEEEMLARSYAKEQLKKYIHPGINVKIL